jgi:hypothetical protein
MKKAREREFPGLGCRTLGDTVLLPSIVHIPSYFLMISKEIAGEKGCSLFPHSTSRADKSKLQEKKGVLYFLTAPVERTNQNRRRKRVFSISSQHQ